jgi:arylsulfatase A-like enzyme
MEQGGKQAVRMANWKGIKLDVNKNPDAPIELYNMADDIGETNNIADQYPEIAEQIQKTMQEAHTSAPDWPLLSEEFISEQ